MKVKPSKVLLIVCGGGVCLAALLGLVGMATNSPELKKAGGVCFLIAAVVAFLPLTLGCCYLLWKKIPSLFRRGP